MDRWNFNERLASLSPAKRALLEVRLREQCAMLPAEHTIQRRVTRGPAPLSFAQQRLWFIHQLEPESAAYNQPNAKRLQGAIDTNALRSALDAIVERHEVLRTTFVQADGGAPVQLINEMRSVDLALVDLSGCPDVKREAELQRVIAEFTERSFDLSRDPMLRSALLKLGAAEQVLLLVKHHIASDGWSSGILWRELATLYNAFSRGTTNPLPELPIQYADYAVWQREQLQGEVLETLLSYWRKQLSGVPLLQLPTDRPRPRVQGYRGAKQSRTLPRTLADRLNALSRVEGVTLFMTLLAAFTTLLYRYTGQEDIVVGTDVANRTRAETEGLIGFFVNLLALRTNLSGNPVFRELMERVRKTTLDAYAHQDLPFDKLIEVLRPERSVSHHPLFQVLFVYQNAPKQEFRFSDLTSTTPEYDNAKSKFDLGVFLREKGDELVFSWVYRTDLFDGATIARMSEQYETLLESIVAQPDTRLQDLDIISEAERNRRAVNEKQKRQSQREGLRSARRNAVDLSQRNLIRMDYLQPGKTFPLVVQPNLDDVDIVGWAEGNRDFIERQLLKHGAILFRGFNVSSAAHFESFALAICPELFGDYGDLPRVGISGNVYESTPYPPDQAILFHNESAHMHRWPMKQWFFCLQAAQQGGETPIVDGRTLYRQIGAGVLERFANKQIMYVRNFTDNLDVSWQAFFKTSDRSIVESFCRDASIDFEWKENDGLRTRHVCPAVAKHPKTGEIVWFNQLQHWHTAALDRATRQSLLSLFRREDLPRNCYYGDGSPIEDSVMEEISGVYRDCAVDFPWRQGDILMVDNMLTAHARNPYVGPRKILVAMGEMIGIESLSTRNPF